MAGAAGIGRHVFGQFLELAMQKWGYSLGVIVMAVSSAFGGLQAVAEKPTALNVPVEGGPWKVTVTGARLVGELPPMYLSDKGNYWIVVLATVEITADRTWNVLGETVQLAPLKGIKSEPTELLTGAKTHRNDGIVLLRDASRIDQLNPGMPEKLAFFWELEGTAAIPKEVTVYIGFRKFRKDGLSGHMSWMPHPEHNKTVVVPVVDRREATAASS